MAQLDWSRLSLFSDLTQEGLTKVQTIFAEVHFEIGQNVIEEGQAGDEMFILIQGKVRITKAMILEGFDLNLPGMDNSHKVLATLDASTYPVFGEMALLDRDQRSATVTTTEASTFLRTDRRTFFDLTLREPALGCTLLAAIGKRLAATVRKTNSDLIKATTALALALSIKS